MVFIAHRAATEGSNVARLYEWGRDRLGRQSLKECSWYKVKWVSN